MAVPCLRRFSRKDRYFPGGQLGWWSGQPLCRNFAAAMPTYGLLRCRADRRLGGEGLGGSLFCALEQVRALGAGGRAAGELGGRPRPKRGGVRGCGGLARLYVRPRPYVL